MSTSPGMLHPELLAPDDPHAVVRDGRRLDHAEAASKPLRPRPEPQLRGAKVRGSRAIDQALAAERFIAAPEHAKMHDERLWDPRQKRDREMHGIAKWEELRWLASAIKEHTLTHLDQYLEQFEANARANGVLVHWARDAVEHNRIVHGILKGHGAKSLIKSKSMLAEECGFRPYMASVGIDVIETDLGERIQQLDNEDPSHVVVPAVHKLRTDVAEVFAKTIGTDPDNDDVHYLAEPIHALVLHRCPTINWASMLLWASMRPSIRFKLAPEPLPRTKCSDGILQCRHIGEPQGCGGGIEASKLGCQRGDTSLDFHGSESP
jgi:L-lactate dehydrogenase complex protein LldF